ncbi:DnaB-like helicase C-terminal domain-containing protein [Nonomuraea sp. NPDC026600]|uniref:replicative DNA helicase n=1 Tax=Nonomuraea sp. NPDC026600 TaxID=3155363 RepID=UPI0033CD7C36
MSLDVSALPGEAPGVVEIETEAAVLGAVLANPSFATTLIERVAAADFVRAVHQVIYGLIVDAEAGGREPSFLVISQGAQRLGDLVVLRYLPLLTEAARAVTTADAFGQHLGEVSNYAYIRKVNAAGIRLADLSAGASLEEIDAVRERALALLDGAAAPVGDDPDEVTWDELYRRDMDAAENPTAVAVVPLPYRDLAKLLNGGLRAGNLVIVGARPAMGKSLVAGEICRHAAIEGVNTLLVTLEMNHQEVSARLTSATARIELSKTVTMTEQRNVLSAQDWDRLAAGYEIAAEAGPRLTVLDPSGAFTVAHLERRLTAMRRKGTPFELVVVDYLQLLSSLGPQRPENRQAEVQKMSRDLKLLAKRFAIPIVVLAQLNRGPEQRADHTPMMADLRESGGLENDANVVILLHRPSVYDEMDRPGEIDLIVAKNRNGATGTVAATFRGHFASVNDFARFCESVD